MTGTGKTNLCDGRRFTHILFDADDTLWCNEEFFREAERRFARRIAEWEDADRTVEIVTRKQEENIRLFGYGSKTFLISMLDAAAEICGEGGFDARLYLDTKRIILDLAYHEFTLIDGVEEVLERLEKEYTLVLATKGDLTEQLHKFRVSGLAGHFTHVEVMRDKSAEDYLALTRKLGANPARILMVGNAIRSDIAPVIEIGGSAVHIPYKVSWAHELMEMPDSERIFELKSIKNLPDLLFGGHTA